MTTDRHRTQSDGKNSQDELKKFYDFALI